jgi:hypothetical protein
VEATLPALPFYLAGVLGLLGLATTTTLPDRAPPAAPALRGGPPSIPPRFLWRLGFYGESSCCGRRMASPTGADLWGRGAVSEIERKAERRVPAGCRRDGQPPTRPIGGLQVYSSVERARAAQPLLN